VRLGLVLLFLGLALALVVGSWRARGRGGGEGMARPEEPLPVVEGVVVHVVGAVARPGIYRLPRGARVGEAVAMAGGFREEADTEALNLARVLRDGEQVRIPERGGSSSGSGGSEGGALLDLNSASREELQKIPGIGPVLAERLVRYREEHGPFGSPEDLLQVPGIGPSKLREIKAFLGVP